MEVPKGEQKGAERQALQPAVQSSADAARVQLCFPYKWALNTSDVGGGNTSISPRGSFGLVQVSEMVRDFSILFNQNWIHKAWIPLSAQPTTSSVIRMF